jgi:Protein of unknown function (DUF2797)
MTIIIQKMRTHVVSNSQNQSPQPNELPLVSQNLTVAYSLADLNLSEGQRIRIRHTGRFFCTSCGKNVKKLFDGFCFGCLKSKAEADICVMSPHRCHFHLGTCREPSWGEEHCFQKHFVYLSYTDKFKVGITRHTQLPTRWVDQGASSASVIAEVPNRYIAGVLEKSLSQFIPDKTHWMKMLLNFEEPPSLKDWVAKLREVETDFLPTALQDFGNMFANTPQEEVRKFFRFNNVVYNIAFPQDKIEKNLKKVASLNLEKTPTIEGELLGIKGQYLYFASGVTNIRRHSGYEVEIEAG